MTYSLIIPIYNEERTLSALLEKLDKLEKITSVDGGYSSDKPSGDKGFDDLSDNEQESYLRRAAAQLDDSM